MCLYCVYVCVSGLCGSAGVDFTAVTLCTKGTTDPQQTTDADVHIYCQVNITEESQIETGHSDSGRGLPITPFDLPPSLGNHTLEEVRMGVNDFDYRDGEKGSMVTGDGDGDDYDSGESSGGRPEGNGGCGVTDDVYELFGVPQMGRNWNDDNDGSGGDEGFNEGEFSDVDTVYVTGEDEGWPYFDSYDTDGEYESGLSAVGGVRGGEDGEGRWGWEGEGAEESVRDVIGGPWRGENEEVSHGREYEELRRDYSDLYTEEEEEEGEEDWDAGGTAVEEEAIPGGTGGAASGEEAQREREEEDFSVGVGGVPPTQSAAEDHEGTVTEVPRGC